jgi:STE24 endopeptidase
VLKTFAPAFGFPDPSAVATLPLLALTGFVLSLLLLVPTNAFSRWNEGKADDFAVRLSGNPQAFVGAMERLAALNLADKDPHPLIEFIFYSHPSIAKRIQRAEAAKTAESGKGGNPA